MTWPALIAAVVTAGSFFVLLVSEFRGFSNFGFLAGFGTLIIGLALFALLGEREERAVLPDERAALVLVCACKCC